MKRASPREAFLDTSFLLPFLQVPIRVEGFDAERFAAFTAAATHLYVSELSVYEAKAKLARLARGDRAYLPAFQRFGTNLAVLREDPRFIFHAYAPRMDPVVNALWSLMPSLDSFDACIVAQAAEVGLLLTEDREILTLRTLEAFRRSDWGRGLQIRRWKEV